MLVRGRTSGVARPGCRPSRPGRHPARDPLLGTAFSRLGVSFIRECTIRLRWTQVFTALLLTGMSRPCRERVAAGAPRGTWSIPTTSPTRKSSSRSGSHPHLTFSSACKASGVYRNSKAWHNGLPSYQTYHSHPQTLGRGCDVSTCRRAGRLGVNPQ